MDYDAKLTKIVETYEYNEDDNKILTKTTETYELPTEGDLDALLEEAKSSRDFNLVGHTKKFKEAKYKKEELVKDEYYILTLKKEF